MHTYTNTISMNVSRGSTMEPQSSLEKHSELTLLLESESRFVNKYNQPRSGKTTQVRVMVMVCRTVGKMWKIALKLYPSFRHITVINKLKLKKLFLKFRHSKFCF